MKSMGNHLRHPWQWLALVGLLGVLWVAGCGDDEGGSDDDAVGECQTNSDCVNGTCLDGVCIQWDQVCTSNADCVSPQVCVQGACTAPATSCVDATQCAIGQQCQNGVCVTPSSNIGSSSLVIGNTGEGGTVTTAAGSTLTFATGSVTPGSTISLADAPYDTVESGGMTLDVVAGFDVVIDGNATAPAEISIPNTANLPLGSQILTVEIVELQNGTSAINFVGTASVTANGTNIVSNNLSDSAMFLGEYGVDETGTYLMLQTAGDQGFTVGQVTAQAGIVTADAAVFSSSGVFVGVTDDNGYFAIPETIGSTTLYVNNPLTGAYGNIYVAVSAVYQVVQINLVTPQSINTGLPNGCLDVTDFDTYSVIGNTSVVSALEPVTPIQGGGMVHMSSGGGAQGEKTSGMDITFMVPAGVSSVDFAYMFLSNEYPEYVGSQYNDLFNVLAYTTGGSALIVEERVNNAVMTDSATIYDGATTWKGVSIDVAAFAGTGAPITLSFVVSDVADTIYDTAVLIDDLRFNTGACEGETTVQPVDADMDGYTADLDCNDGNAAVNPSADEICGDMVDNNCNGTVDEECSGIIDADNDTYPPEEDCNDNDATVYPGAPEACDEVDNDCDGYVDESCVMELPQSHHVDFSSLSGFLSNSMYAIYQRFDSTYPVDLDGLTLSFVPSNGNTQYTVTASSLAWDANEGTLSTGDATDTGSDDMAANCDDCYDTIALPFAFNFYGTVYNEVFIGENGYLTFGVGDTTYTDSVEYFLAAHPRISAMFDDLDTRGGDTQADDIYIYVDSAKLVLTCRNFQHYPTTGSSNTFQFVLLSDGTIRISFSGIQDITTGAVTGISPGQITTGVDVK